MSVSSAWRQIKVIMHLAGRANTSSLSSAGGLQFRSHVTQEMQPRVRGVDKQAGHAWTLVEGGSLSCAPVHPEFTHPPQPPGSPPLAGRPEQRLHCVCFL